MLKKRKFLLVVFLPLITIVCPSLFNWNPASAAEQVLPDSLSKSPDEPLRAVRSHMAVAILREATRAREAILQNHLPKAKDHISNALSTIERLGSAHFGGSLLKLKM